MKTDLVIRMEEECVDCPKLELETVRHRGYSSHQCVHIDFCKAIVRNLIDHGWKKEGDS